MAALDPNKLTRNELVQLVNSTPQGSVLTRARLDRQMNRAGRRWHDGRHIRLPEYVRWLAEEADRPPEPKPDARAADLARKNAETYRRQNIAPVPEVVDPGRQAEACEDFRFFCETYFTTALYRGWSADHLRVIEQIERAVKEGGLFAFAMPRGSGKTTLARLSALWAVLAGYRPFVCLIGGSQDRAVELLSPIRKAILENPRLLEDFPAAVYPLRCLENNARRQMGQHIDGWPTYCTWATDKLVFPTVEGATASGSIITVTSLDSNIRGQQHTRMDGQVIRPSLVLLDDPQTRQSARSPSQTQFRLQLLNGDVLCMAGPGESISAVLTCTKIYHDDLADQVLDREKNPEWQGECTKLVYDFPTDTKLWDRYAQERAESLRMGHDGREATEYYRKHREAMDAGARVAWPERYDKAKELSALQHAMNLKLRDEAAFFAEYQNEPVAEDYAREALTPDEVAAKASGRPSGHVPTACTRMTMFVDVHDKLLFWCVCAWQEDFTGSVVDYGAHPDQKRAVFTLRDARRSLRHAAPGTGREGAITAGLIALCGDYLAREWQRDDGAVLRIERCLVDAGYMPTVVYDACRRVGGAMMPAKGVGIGAAHKPMAEYRRKKGEVCGHHWHIPNVRGTRELRHVRVDTNYWKTFCHDRLATADGDRGCLSLPGRPGDHRAFADHVAASEYWVRTEGRGRTVNEWKPRPGAPDNHWLDCLVGAAVAASTLGVSLEGTVAMRRQKTNKRKRKKVSYL